ncbi:MAG TPA: SAM-dependent methyltransferase [Candidatus Akkermansia intestinigallinarum]|mgnify:CR=1 FL=1|uniref:SAM-dependent methyltransferase n=1 Tax=Candidatus Akkermansia intestinigallinarum TaxID=2838431 RepID=A0A9D1VC45_9BACT|nr:SAM-dependent methyltransferase [Candidatus Akkermansia intestinigallinarum]
MYAQTAVKSHILLRNGAYGIVMRGVQKCTCADASLRDRNALPLCCIKLDTATDPCCGSGAFLVRALTEAIDDCNGNIADEQKVKKEQIYGIEDEEYAFGLSTTNMLIHGDGNSNVISVDMFCKAYYQPKPFYAVGHGRINMLLPKFEMNVYRAMYICAVINNERYRFSYGRAVYSGVLKDLQISLPVDANGNPDWQYMEDYIKSLPAGDKLANL